MKDKQFRQTRIQTNIIIKNSKQKMYSAKQKNKHNKQKYKTFLKLTRIQIKSPEINSKIKNCWSFFANLNTNKNSKAEQIKYCT